MAPRCLGRHSAVFQHPSGWRDVCGSCALSHAGYVLCGCWLLAPCLTTHAALCRDWSRAQRAPGTAYPAYACCVGPSCLATGCSPFLCCVAGASTSIALMSYGYFMPLSLTATSAAARAFVYLQCMLRSAAASHVSVASKLRTSEPCDPLPVEVQTALLQLEASASAKGQTCGDKAGAGTDTGVPEAGRTCRLAVRDGYRYALW